MVVTKLRTIPRAYRADAALVVVTVVWGATFVTVKGALDGIGPFEFLALRFSVAFAVLAALFPGRLRRLTPTTWRNGAIVGLFLFAGYALQTVGLESTTVSKAGFITGLAVVIVPVFAFAALRERPGFNVILGVILATVGLWILSFEDASGFAPGDLLMLGCAVAFAAQVIAVGVYAPGEDPIDLTTAQMASVAVASTLGTVLFERSVAAPSGSVWLAVVFTGVVASALAQTIQARAQRFTTVTHTALIFSLEPVFAALAAVLVGGESLGPRELVGGGLILAGMLAAEIRRPQSTGIRDSRVV